MSLENAKRFIDAVGKDPALQQRLAAAVREPAEGVRLAVQAGSERGLPFTGEEFLAVMRTMPGDAGGELSDDQLESVAGGLGISPNVWASMMSLFKNLPTGNPSTPGGAASVDSMLKNIGSLPEGKPPS